MSHKWVPICCALFVMLIYTSIVLAGGPKVSAMGNKHNLSAQNISVTHHAVDDPINNPGGQQICIFCHTPHSSSSQGPLWNRKDTTQVFARYTSNTLQIRSLAVAGYDSAWQPNGSSRLCLSCHDGVTPLGGVINSGQNGDIQMLGGNSISQADVASFHPSTNKMKNGHHPVSFVYATAFDYKTQSGTIIGLQPTFGPFRLPNAVSMEGKVKLQDSKRDKRGWMQCTTCHDAHQNMGNDVSTYPATTRKITPFWVYSAATAVTAHDTVCTSCHTSLGVPYNVGVGGANPWPTP